MCLPSPCYSLLRTIIKLDYKHTVPGGLAVKTPPATQERGFDPSVREIHPLEKEVANHSSILAWEIPWTEEPRGLQSMG